jgi:hypothetical protein
MPKNAKRSAQIPVLLGSLYIYALFYVYFRVLCIHIFPALRNKKSGCPARSCDPRAV